MTIIDRLNPLSTVELSDTMNNKKNEDEDEDEDENEDEDEDGDGDEDEDESGGLNDDRENGTMYNVSLYGNGSYITV